MTLTLRGACFDLCGSDILRASSRTQRITGPPATDRTVKGVTVAAAVIPVPAGFIPGRIPAEASWSMLGPPQSPELIFAASEAGIT